jgi:hypothetical protein
MILKAAPAGALALLAAGAGPAFAQSTGDEPAGRAAAAEAIGATLGAVPAMDVHTRVQTGRRAPSARVKGRRLGTADRGAYVTVLAFAGR